MSENPSNFTIVLKIVNTCRSYTRKKKPSPKSESNRMYLIWYMMNDRCHNPQSKAYVRYGGRGITVCQQWRESLDQFCADMGPRPSMFHSVERLDNNSGYCTENCVWGTPSQQTRNKTSNRWFTYNGERLILTDLANKYQLNYGMLYSRVIKLGWPIEKAMETKSKHEKLILYDGEAFTMRGLSKRLNIGFATVIDRLRRGWNLEDAFTRPMPNQIKLLCSGSVAGDGGISIRPLTTSDSRST